MKTFLTLIIIVSSISIISCSKTKAPAPGDEPQQQDTTDPNPTKSNTELLTIKWIVDEAYVDGSTPDNSSKGLKVEFNNTFDYTLFQKNGSTYIGTWTFLDNEGKMDLDAGTQFHQVWTIKTLTEDKLDVTFKSPFTGQNAQWIMIAD